ncbi:MAG: hypothetical protein ACE5F5_11710 [Acidimicrobiia bacterium]
MGLRPAGVAVSGRSRLDARQAFPRSHPPRAQERSRLPHGPGVISFDPETKESVVASAYGTRADWYRNIQAEPALRVQTGRLDYVPEQRFLTPAEARKAAARFCLEHPLEAKLMPRVLPAIGAALPLDPDLEPVGQLATLPMVAFRPKS